MRNLWVIFIAFISFSCFSSPKSELWPYWNVSTNSTSTIDHSPWQAILDNYVVNKGEYTLFRYSSVSKEDRASLQQYIDTLTDLDPRQYSKSEQYAYWVNLYNAVTVEIILDNYPLKSITKLGGFFSFGPWDKNVITVNDKDLTLNDIEHRILRPIWNDPRTHYAINCASLGCPNLQPQAFTASNSEQLLELSAKTFINSDKGAKINGNTLRLSSIYDWFAVDFGGEAKVLYHLTKYRPDLANFDGKITFDYDWSLNQAK
jgi:hypothetical protein